MATLHGPFPRLSEDFFRPSARDRTRDNERHIEYIKHVFEQATNQPKFEIFPEGDKDFFLKVVDAEITFVTDAQGRAEELILHQGGADQHARRVE